jgi:HD superfamily phosphohydrolase
MMVYMHKTTRSAEVMFRRFLELLRAAAPADDELRRHSRLAAFIASEAPSLGEYLSLDDAVVWSDISGLRQFGDAAIRELAAGLVDRRLYKAFDLGAAVGERDEGNRRLRFMRCVKEQQRAGRFPGLLIDNTPVAGYKRYEFESTSALGKVLVKREKHDVEPRDIAEFSNVVQSLIARANIHRLYVPSADEAQQIDQLFEDTPP